MHVDGICLNKVALNEPCINDLQCTDQAVCEDGKCACDTGYMESKDKCVRGRESFKISV